MAEHPILMSGLMVRAILGGRKSQTRRVIRPQPTNMDDERRRLSVLTDCPYGGPGDLLWVRETWQVDPAGEWGICYKATGHNKLCRLEDHLWRPSIHMPRWASRLTLRLTDVRVQRVQEISEEDAQAEGIRKEWRDVDGNPIFGSGERIGFGHADQAGTAREVFARLWDSLNAKRGYSWDSNPWVRALTFERMEAPHG